MVIKWFFATATVSFAIYLAGEVQLCALDCSVLLIALRVGFLRSILAKAPYGILGIYEKLQMNVSSDMVCKMVKEH